MVNKNSPLVSVIVLNWNRIDDTLTCINSVRKLSYPNIEIIVVDNGSYDNSKKVLSELSDIIFVNNPTNRGFTGGHIDGFTKSTGKYILILNNDAVIDPTYVDVAVDAAEKDPTIGAVGGRAYIWDDKHPSYSTANPFYAYQNINPVTAEGIFSQTDTGVSQIVNSVSGSATLLSREALEKTGYFYDPFFAYYEETDLFARMKRCGYKIIYSPALHIWHKSGSSSSSYFQFNQLYKNRLIFAIRNFETSFLPRFIKSYIRTGLQSTYMRFKKTDNKDLHKGFSNAFIINSLLWPKYLYVRKKLQRQIGINNTYNLEILKEQTQVSIIYDATDLDKVSFERFTKKILSEKSNYDANIETIVVVSKPSYTINGITMVLITNTYADNALDIAWLSARGSYIYFPQDNAGINIGKILSEAVSLDQNAKWISKHIPMLMHKDLLVHRGGLRSKPGEKIADSLQLFCYFWDSKKTFLSDAERSDLEKKYKVDYIRSIKAQAHSNKIQDKAPSKWSVYLDRHYRTYQLVLLVRWIFSTKTSIRLKLARLKNLVLFMLKLNRKLFAIELKHMRNELFLASHFGVDVGKQNKKIAKKLALAKKNNFWKNIPVFIICRDRFDELNNLLNWLEKIGMSNIVLIDNDSIYPPLVKYLGSTPYQVIKTQNNIGHTVPWTGGIVRTLVPEDLYIVTDPDVIPDENCPDNVIEYFITLHEKYFSHQKVGFGLRIDNLPEHYHLKQSVINWESQFWVTEMEKDVYEAGVDTTFALYKPFVHRYIIHPSIRTGGAYVARHAPWYTDSKKITSEEEFYRARLNKEVTSWNVEEIAERYKIEFKRMEKR